MADLVNSPQIIPSPFAYDESPKAALCTVMACSGGHEWTPTLQLTQCPGCKSPILAVKMVQCPQCNEPASSLRLRADHLCRGAAITPVCRGSATMAEVIGLDIQLAHAAKVEANYKERQMPSKI